MKEGESFWSYKLREWMRDFTSLANPLILVFVPFVFLGPSKPYWVLLIALAINETLGSLIKYLFHKPRPTGQKYSNALEKIDAGSFPSLHSSRIAVVYLTLFWHAELLVFNVLFLLVIVIVGCSRVFLRKHYWSDVAGGMFFGVLVFLASVYLGA